MVRLRFGSLLRCVVLCVVLGVFAGPATAAPKASDALTAWGSSEASYVYARFDDFGEIQSRLMRSTMVRLAIDLIREDLGLDAFFSPRIMPAETMAMAIGMVGDDRKSFRAQFAFTFPPTLRPVVDKIEAGKATPAEVSELFGLGFAEEPDSPFKGLISAPDASRGHHFYTVFSGVLDFMMTARGGVVIFGAGESDIRSSLASLARRAPRLAPKLSLDGKNAFLIDLDSSMTQDMLEDIADYDEEVRGKVAQRGRIEAGLSLAPDGWAIDIESNIVEMMAPGLKPRMTVKEPGSFVSVGGSKPLATIYSTPNLNRIYESSTAMRALADLGRLFELAYDVSNPFKLGLLFDESPRTKEALDKIDRINVAVAVRPTEGTVSASDFVLMTYLGSDDPSAMAYLQGELDKTISPSMAEKPDRVTVERASGSAAERGWEKVYRFRGNDWENGEGEKTKVPPVLVAFGKSAIVTGIGFSIGELGEPFVGASKEYESLNAKAGLQELIYIDFESIRKLILSVVSARNGERSYSTRRTLPLLVVTSDLREMTMETHSITRFRIEAKTGRPSFEDREAILKMAGASTF